MDANKKSIWKRWYMIVLYVFVGLIIIGSLLPDSNDFEKTEKDTFDAIAQVKSNNLEIPTSSSKGYQEEWKQEQIDNNVWMITLTTEWRGTVTNAIWKVSPQRILCSETKETNYICSENGWAKTYSNLDYCKPTEFCEMKKAKQEETTTTQEKTFDQLREEIDSVSADDKLTSLNEENGIYEIKFEYVSLDNKAVDESVLEDLVFRIMEVFLEDIDVNDLDKKREIVVPNLQILNIEFSTTTPIKSGVLSTSKVTREHIQKYGTDPYSIDAEDFAFTFDESFY